MMIDDTECNPDPPRPRSNPRWEDANNAVSIHALKNPACSLVEELGGLVDDLRQLLTDFGLRPYRLVSIVTCWSGGVIGRGTEHIVSEVELLPTPKMTPSSLRTESKPGGTNDSGTMRVSEISPRYTEDDIRALFHVQPLPAPNTGFVEMRMDGRDGCSVRRRFVVSGVPERDSENFQWVATLAQQNPARSRDGALNSQMGVVF